MRVGTSALEVSGEPPGDQGRPVDGHLVDPAGERCAGATAQRAADPDLVVVHDRRLGRLATQIPVSGYRLAVQVAPQTVRFAEDIGHRDVVPGVVGTKADAGDPAVEVVAVSLPVVGIAEQEADPSCALATSQSQSPVLVRRFLSRVVRPTLADEVDVLLAADLFQLNPGLQCDRITIGEIQRAVLARIGDHQAVTAGETHREVGVIEKRIEPWPWPGDAQLD